MLQADDNPPHARIADDIMATVTLRLPMNSSHTYLIEDLHEPGVRVLLGDHHNLGAMKLDDERLSGVPELVAPAKARVDQLKREADERADPVRQSLRRFGLA